MARSTLRLALVLCLLASLVTPGLAQGVPQGSPSDKDQSGQFDFYVLALSWSPSFCAAAAERGAGRASGLQCGGRPYSFVVHGLWPQYEHGFPQDCQVPAPRLNHALVSSMLDLMPAPRLVFNEWDRHGTCSGMSPQAYFDTVRRARAGVKIPPEYADPRRLLTVSPNAVEDAFIKANPGLAPDDIAVECDKTRLTEVRLCLSKDLKFRACPQLVKRRCRRDHIGMPPLRGPTAVPGGAN